MINDSKVKPTKQDEDVEVKLEETNEVDERIEKLENLVQRAQEGEKRVFADYQNLIRRTEEERSKIAKLAGRNIIEELLQPFEHLFLAKEQLKDQGLNMVYQQFQQAFQSEGVEEIQCLGKPFDPVTMEVIDKVEVEDKKQVNTVIKVTQRGYRLHGEVIRHAKVVMGISK